MKIAPLPKHEKRRLEALRRTGLLDTPPSPEFDDATKLASYICGAPIALISLVDDQRQWFKSRVGLGAQETPRDVAFCPLSLLMIDVDHFKRFNDECGHAAGDGVLQAVARLMADSVRAEDIVCRYGGEEFVIVLPDVDPATCARRARELCASVRSMAVEHHGELLRAVSISIGVATLGQDGTTAGDLLHAADAALYCAKEQGRDRVVEAWPTRSTSLVVDPLADPAGARAA